MVKCFLRNRERSGGDFVAAVVAGIRDGFSSITRAVVVATAGRVAAQDTVKTTVACVLCVTLARALVIHCCMGRSREGYYIRRRSR